MGPRYVPCFVTFVVGLCGCGKPIGADSSNSVSVTPPPRSTISTPVSPPEKVAEVTPAAAEAFHNIARENGVKAPYRMRIFIVPGSCQGYQHKLDLDQEPLKPSDRTVGCGSVTVVYDDAQYPFIQGSKIDYVQEKDGKTGFKVEMPNKTAANKRRMSDWVQAEIAKISKTVPQ